MKKTETALKRGAYKPIVEQLLKKGFKKWDIKKFCGVKWQTVHNWHLGVNNPKEESTRKKISEMLRMTPMQLKKIFEKQKACA